MTKTKTMAKTKTKTFWAILETCDIWDTEYNSDNWEPEFMTIFVTWQLIVTLDSIRNSCNVFDGHYSPSDIIIIIIIITANNLKNANVIIGLPQEITHFM